MADGDKALTTTAAAKLLEVNAETVRRYGAKGYLRVRRATVQGHRRVSERSVHELAEVLAMDLGDERDAALEALRRKNLGLAPDTEE